MVVAKVILMVGNILNGGSYCTIKHHLRNTCTSMSVIHTSLELSVSELIFRYNKMIQN